MSWCMGASSNQAARNWPWNWKSAVTIGSWKPSPRTANHDGHFKRAKSNFRFRSGCICGDGRERIRAMAADDSRQSQHQGGGAWLSDHARRRVEIYEYGAAVATDIGAGGEMPRRFGFQGHRTLWFWLGLPPAGVRRWIFLSATLPAARGSRR